MNAKNIFLYFLCVSFSYLLTSIPSTAVAEYAFNDSAVPEESAKAGQMVFQSLSIWFKALEILEGKNYSEATKLKGKMVKLLEEVIKLQKVVKEKSSGKRLFTDLAPGRLNEIKKELKYLKKPFPKTRAELRDIAIQELNSFNEWVGTIRFGDDPKVNRRQIRTMNDKIWDLVSLGIAVSELSQ